MLNADDLLNGIYEAIKGGVTESLEQVAERARHKAPVRKIFASTGRRRNTKGPQTVSAQTFNPERSPMHHPARFGLEIQAAVGIDNLRSKGRGARAGQYEISDSRIRGRINSWAPVVQSPAGLIGGEALRRLSATGVLQVQQITHAGGTFSAHDLLSARGRAELRSGRGNYFDPQSKETTLGGKLRGSIKVEGPFQTRDEIYGFVSAAAFNEQGFNYALAQEIGTAHNPAQPYLRPSLRELHDSISKDAVGKRAASAFRRGIERTAHRGSTPTRGRMVKLKWSFVGFDKVTEGLGPAVERS